MPQGLYHAMKPFSYHAVAPTTFKYGSGPLIRPPTPPEFKPPGDPSEDETVLAGKESGDDLKRDDDAEVTEEGEPGDGAPGIHPSTMKTISLTELVLQSPKPKMLFQLARTMQRSKLQKLTKIHLTNLAKMKP